MQVEFTENLEFAVVLFIKEMIPPFLTDVFIITVTLHRFEPSVSRLKNSKREYGINFELPLIRLFCESRYCYYKIRMILRNHSAYT